MLFINWRLGKQSKQGETFLFNTSKCSNFAAFNKIVLLDSPSLLKTLNWKVPSLEKSNFVKR